MSLRQKVAAVAAALALAVGAGFAGHEIDQPTPAPATQNVREACPPKTGKVPPKYDVESRVSPECIAALNARQLDGAIIPPTSGRTGLAQSYANGQYPCSALRPVTGGVSSSSWPCSGMLAPQAAAAWNAFAVYVHNRTGQWVQADGPLSSYRSLAGQQYLYSHCPSVCAYPGRSNHGWGLANDINPFSQSEVRSFGGQFGWGIGYGSCSDAPYESWHAKYCGGYSGPDPGPYGSGGGGGGPKPFKVLKLGDGGPRVRALNCRYLHLGRVRRAKGHGHYATHGTRHYGPGMKLATKHFQHDSHLHVDGVYGERSNGKMGPRWRAYKQHHADPHCGAIGRR